MVAGPYATLLLVDLGAEVIKVEPPRGDQARDLGPRVSPGMGAVFVNANRGKRSVVLDLTTDAGRDALEAAHGDRRGLRAQPAPGRGGPLRRRRRDAAGRPSRARALHDPGVRVRRALPRPSGVRRHHPGRGRHRRPAGVGGGRADLRRHRDRRQGRRADRRARDHRGAPRTLRDGTRQHGRGADVRVAGRVRPARAPLGPHLRAAARRGALPAGLGTGAAPVRDGRRLDLGRRLQQRALEEVLRAHRPARADGRRALLDAVVPHPEPEVAPRPPRRPPPRAHDRRVARRAARGRHPGGPLLPRRRPLRRPAPRRRRPLPARAAPDGGRAAPDLDADHLRRRRPARSIPIASHRSWASTPTRCWAELGIDT